MSAAIILSLVLISLTMVILVYQVIKGERVLHRVLALDLIGLSSIALFILFYINAMNRFYLDLALVLTFVSFVTALVFSTFIPQDKKEKT